MAKTLSPRKADAIRGLAAELMRLVGPIVSGTDPWWFTQLERVGAKITAESLDELASLVSLLRIQGTK